MPPSPPLSLASKKEGWCQDEDEKKNGVGGIASGGEYLWGANCRSFFFLFLPPSLFVAALVPCRLFLAADFSAFFLGAGDLGAIELQLLGAMGSPAHV